MDITQDSGSCDGGSIPSGDVKMDIPHLDFQDGDFFRQFHVYSL